MKEKARAANHPLECDHHEWIEYQDGSERGESQLEYCDNPLCHAWREDGREMPARCFECNQAATHRSKTGHAIAWCEQHAPKDAYKIRGRSDAQKAQREEYTRSDSGPETTDGVDRSQAGGAGMARKLVEADPDDIGGEQ